jgi:RNA 2',3'-cyclic 3'-phosphodiesterase
VALEAGRGAGPLLGEARGRLPFSGIRWVASHQHHFTLKFLGGIEAELLAAARAALEGAARDLAPFDLELAGLGAFPSQGPPRIVWVGCGAGRESLVAGAAAIEESFAAAGFPREPRPFSPHLTIGRVKDPRSIPSRPFREALAREEAARFGTVEARELVLFRSDLSPAGPAYTPLARVLLAAPTMPAS